MRLRSVASLATLGHSCVTWWRRRESDEIRPALSMGLDGLLVIPRCVSAWLYSDSELADSESVAVRKLGVR